MWDPLEERRWQLRQPAFQQRPIPNQISLPDNENQRKSIFFNPTISLDSTGSAIKTAVSDKKEDLQT